MNLHAMFSVLISAQLWEGGERYHENSGPKISLKFALHNHNYSTKLCKHIKFNDFVRRVFLHLPRYQRWFDICCVPREGVLPSDEKVRMHGEGILASWPLTSLVPSLHSIVLTCTPC